MNSHGPSDSFVRELTTAQNPLFAYAFSLISDREAAADVLQETNIEMLRKWQDFTEGTNFLAWACTIARFKVLKHYEQTRKDRLVFDDELLNQLAVEAERQASEGAYSAILDDCLEEMKPAGREMLARRYTSDETVKQIAEQAGRSPSSVGVSIFRLRQQLLECIQRKLLAEANA